MKKKFWGFVLALSMLFAIMPMAVNAETSGECGNNVKWALENGMLTISGEGDMAVYNPIVSIPWYSSRSEITDIVIENGVTSIAENVFAYSENLTTVSIPPSVTSIGSGAFSNCDSLTGVYISDLAVWCGIDFHRSTTLRGANLYLNGELVTDLVIPDGVTSISEKAFICCASLTEVSIPPSVTSIGEAAFAYCPNVTAINVPDSVMVIGEDAFCDCDKLTEINVDENNPSYMSDNGVLFNKEQTALIDYPENKSGSSYTIPDGVTDIGVSALSFCSNLETIHIPDSVTTIESYAFEGCKNLTSLTIPDGVTYLRYAMAVDCEKLASISLPDGIMNIDYNVFDGTAYYKDSSNWTDGVLYINNYLIEASNELSGDYAIKDGTRVIASAAMYECKNVTGITIPESVISIGVLVFDGTAYYKDPSNWTDNALYIDNCLIDTKQALSGDYAIKDGTRLIAESTFFWSSSLTSITIPDSVKNIGYLSFFYKNENIALIFNSPSAPVLNDCLMLSDGCKIYIHEGYVGYTAENGYDDSKITVEPHNYENGKCTVCGAKKETSAVVRTDSEADGDYSFNVAIEQAGENCCVYAAVYDINGVLLAVNSVPLATTGSTDVSIGKDDDAAQAKVFVWEDTLQPIITAASFTL